MSKELRQAVRQTCAYFFPSFAHLQTLRRHHLSGESHEDFLFEDVEVEGRRADSLTLTRLGLPEILLTLTQLFVNTIPSLGAFSSPSPKTRHREPRKETPLQS